MLKLIVKTKLRSVTREITQEWPTYFILGPLMIGTVLLLGRKVFYDFAVDIGRIQPISLAEETIIRLSYVFLFLKVFFNFLPLAKRLYPTEQSLTVDDLLPIDFKVRYIVFYLEQLLRDLPFFIFATVLILFLGKTAFLGWPFMIWILFPGVEIGFTLAWIHVRSPDRLELGGAVLVLLILLWLMPVTQFSWWADAFVFMFVPLGYYKGFKVWRYKDMGRVEQFLIQHQNREDKKTSDNILKTLCRIVPIGIRPLVRRDLILTVRNFVPHFWRNLIISLMIAFSVAVRGAILPSIYCGLGVFTIASTVAPLFALQRPYRQMEGALPLSVEQVWRAKLNYARLISIPIPWIVWGIEIALRPLPVVESFTLLLQLVLVGFAVASLVGGSICEGDQRPVLQYIFAGMMSVVAVLFIAIFNALLFLLLFPILSSLKDSAMTRLEGEGVVS